MVAVINDPLLENDVIAARQATGSDRYDEVWEGIYMMSPLANNEHQALGGRIYRIFLDTIELPGLGQAFPGCNVSDRRDDWATNFRCPDVAVFLNGTSATDCGTHWFGGPDFGVEIVSPFDRTREKFDFYAQIGTRELLIVDRHPWALELYRLQSGALIEAGRSTLAQPDLLASEVVPLSFRLIPGDERPQIAVLHSDGRQQWVI